MPEQLDIRLATTTDISGFLQCWVRYLEENHSLGGQLLPCRENILEGERLLRAYLRGSLFGVAPIALTQQGEAIGALLAGEDWSGASRWVTSLGRTAMVWFVWTHPEWRRQRVSYQLHRVGRKALGELGFDHCISQILGGNEAAEGNALGWGGQFTHRIVVGAIRGNT